MLLNKVNDWEDADLICLSSNTMVVIDPKLQHSTRDCYEPIRASRLASASIEGCLTPRTSYAAAAALPSFSSESSTIMVRSSSSVGCGESLPGTDMFGHLFGRLPAQTWIADPTGAQDETPSPSECRYGII